MGRSDDIKPLPLFLKCIAIEELQPVTVDFDGTPRVSLDQAGKIAFQLRFGQRVRAAIKELCDPAHRTRIDINGSGSFTLQLKVGKVLFIKEVVTLKFCGGHDVYSCIVHRVMGAQGVWWFYALLCRRAASFNKRFKADSQRVAFLVCGKFSDLDGMRKHWSLRASPLTGALSVIT